MRIPNGSYDHSQNPQFGRMIGGISDYDRGKWPVGNGRPYGPWFPGKRYSVCVSEPAGCDVDVLIKDGKNGKMRLIKGTARKRENRTDVFILWGKDEIELTALLEVETNPPGKSKAWRKRKNV